MRPKADGLSRCENQDVAKPAQAELFVLPLLINNLEDETCHRYASVELTDNTVRK